MNLIQLPECNLKLRYARELPQGHRTVISSPRSQQSFIHKTLRHITQINKSLDKNFRYQKQSTVVVTDKKNQRSFSCSCNECGGKMTIKSALSNTTQIAEKYQSQVKFHRSQLKRQHLLATTYTPTISTILETSIQQGKRSKKPSPVRTPLNSKTNLFKTPTQQSEKSNTFLLKLLYSPKSKEIKQTVSPRNALSRRPSIKLKNTSPELCIQIDNIEKIPSCTRFQGKFSSPMGQRNINSPPMISLRDFQSQLSIIKKNETTRDLSKLRTNSYRVKSIYLSANTRIQQKI